MRDGKKERETSVMVCVGQSAVDVGAHEQHIVERMRVIVYNAPQFVQHPLGPKKLQLHSPDRARLPVATNSRSTNEGLTVLFALFLS